MKLNKLKTMSAVAIAAALFTVGAGTAAAATSCVNPGGTGGCYASIQAAINAANNGDTINVAAGTYNESVTVNKTLNLLGARAGVDARTRTPSNESTINSSCSPVAIFADNVILDGFTVQGSTQSDPCLIAGIYTNPGSNASDVGGYKIRNNIVQNNIIGIEMDNTGAIPASVDHNLIQNNNNSGPDGGTGIDTNFGASNVVVDSNKFVGNTNSAIGVFSAASSITWSNNEFDTNSRAFELFNVTSSSISNNNIHNSNDSATADLRLFGGVSGLTVTCNTFANGAGRAIRINDAGFGGGPNSMIIINFNNISGYPLGLVVDAGGYSGGPMSLDATNDWWGAASGPNYNGGGPGTGEPIVDTDGVVKFSPFLGNPSTCAVCPNANPGCTTTRKDCHAFVEQEEKNFNDMQKAQKKAFDAQPHTKQQKKAFDDQQKAAKDAFQAHYKAEEQQCNQLPK